MKGELLKVEHLNKSFGNLEVFKDFSMTFQEGEITCLLGPSGCGKSTLLNILGGIITPDSGSLIGFEGRRFSYIFQEPRLLPWKTVSQNIEFVVERSFSKEERTKKVSELLNRVELSEFADYYPYMLSGGMRQRVSIARSFAVPSDIILMDEPLNGLDSKLKTSMIEWFKQILQADPRTVIYVTHDEEEASLLGGEMKIISSRIGF